MIQRNEIDIDEGRVKRKGTWISEVKPFLVDLLVVFGARNDRARSYLHLRENQEQRKTTRLKGLKFWNERSGFYQFLMTVLGLWRLGGFHFEVVLKRRRCEVVVQGRRRFMSRLRMSSAPVRGQIRLLCMNFWHEIIMAVETGTCGGPLGSGVFFCRFIFEL